MTPAEQLSRRPACPDRRGYHLYIVDEPVSVLPVANEKSITGQSGISCPISETFDLRPPRVQTAANHSEAVPRRRMLEYPGTWFESGDLLMSCQPSMNVDSPIEMLLHAYNTVGLRLHDLLHSALLLAPDLKELAHSGSRTLSHSCVREGRTNQIAAAVYYRCQRPKISGIQDRDTELS